MAGPAEPPPGGADRRPGSADDPADIRALETFAAELLEALEVALPAWVQHCVADRWSRAEGGELPMPVADAARDAAQAAGEAVLPPLRALLARDVGEQGTNPLNLLRGAVSFPTRVLAAAGVPPVDRDAQAERLFPEDVYDLTPGSFADLGELVQEPGLHWGAAKAHVILRRRRS